MRNFQWPESLPEDIAILPKLNGISANNFEYFDAVIERLVSNFLHTKPFTSDSSDERLQEAGESGDTKAWNLLGLRWEFGSETHNVNTREAIRYYTKAAEEGDPGGLYNLAAIYDICSRDLSLLYDYDLQNEIENQKQDEVKNHLRAIAAGFYQKAVDISNFAPALFRLGFLSEEDGEYAAAQDYYEQAAKQNYPPAINALGIYYYIGNEKTVVDRVKAFTFFKKAADLNDPSGIYNYASMLEADNQTDEAINQYQRIAFGIHPVSQAAYALGRLYEKEKNNIIMAVNCYRAAQRGGIQEAEKDIIRCLEKGASEKIDDHKK